MLNISNAEYLEPEVRLLSVLATTRSSHYIKFDYLKKYTFSLLFISRKYIHKKHFFK